MACIVPFSEPSPLQIAYSGQIGLTLNQVINTDRLEIGTVRWVIMFTTN
jgi:hypothetical protein